MKSIIILLISTLGLLSGNIFGQEVSRTNPDKTIFVYGSYFDKTFTRYVASLTQKPNPKICFIPTASADDPYMITAWYETCAELPLRPYVLKTFIVTSPNQKSFEEILLEMDAIVVGGGNTLNMLAIWKAQGIDTVLKKAYDRGIILAGGSAGSLCWFAGGITDSRPKELTLIDGLGFLNYSHSPHYNSEPARKPLYFNAILSGRLKPGYACDERAGLLFINGTLKKSVSQDAENNNYFLTVVDGKVKEELLPAEIIK